MSDLVRVPMQHDFGAPPLEVICFASSEVDVEDPELQSALTGADLILALGNVDLDRIALAIGPEKPALCVLGDRDLQRDPPAPFRLLHGNGVVFNGWRIAGLSGARLDAVPPSADGARMTEQDASAMLSRMPACDLLISHAPPAGQATPHGFRSLWQYVQDQPPIYHFFAAEADHQVFNTDAALLVGVHGALAPPTLVYA